MARLFTAVNSEYMSVGSSPVTGPPFTMACWFRNTAAVTTLMDIMSVMTTANANDGYYLEKNGTSFRATTVASSSASNTSSTSTPALNSANTWFHVCGVFAATNDRRGYINGGNKATNSVSRSPPAATGVGIGCRLTSSPQNFVGGRVAEAAIWNVALADDDVAALGLGMSPMRVRPGSLVGYWPLWGLSSPEPDLTSGARSLTLTGSPTLADHAPAMPRRRLITNLTDATVAAASRTDRMLFAMAG